jgi:DNA-binding NarL/FixJ family response regulator
MQTGPGTTICEGTQLPIEKPYDCESAGRFQAEIKPLSPQMTRILGLLARGLTYEQIANELKITRHTVSSYIQHIFERLNVRTKTEAVVIGINRGIIKA